ncbi:MAG: PAS domain-containing protein [Planctomycetota bacterium]
MNESAAESGDASDLQAHGAVWAALASEPATGVSVITAEGRIVYLNEQAAEIFLGPKVGVADAAGRTLEELYPPEFADERHRLVQRVIDADQPCCSARSGGGTSTCRGSIRSTPTNSRPVNWSRGR